MTAKEKEIREKLVLKLKSKAEGDLSKQKIKVTRAKNDDFESVSDDDLSDKIDVSNDEVEDISEEDLRDSDSDESRSSGSDIDSDEDLRLTSTDDDSDDDKPRRKKKKEKKDKKKRGRDRENRKQRDIDRQVRLAQRIASKRSPVRRSPEYKADLWEHEKYDRERNPGRRDRTERERTPTGYYGAKDYYNNRRRSVEREEREAGGPMDEFERDEYERERFMKASKMKKVERFLRQQGMRKEQIEREMEKAYEQYFSTLAKKDGGRGQTIYTGPRNAEQEKEEQWERMTNPHLFGGDKGAFRKMKVCQLSYDANQRGTASVYFSLFRLPTTTRRFRRRLCRMRSVSVRGGRGRTTAGTTGTAATETGGTRGTTGSGRNTEGPLTGERNLLHLYFMSRN